MVGDKGSHSNETLANLKALGLRSYISEPDRGRPCWKNQSVARNAAYSNRRRVRGERGRRLPRCRGELLARPFAHVWETGGMRRVHLRGHPNILKRILVHVAGCNIGMLLRHLHRRAHAAEPSGPCGVPVSCPTRAIVRPVRFSEPLEDALHSDFGVDGFFTARPEHPLIHMTVESSTSGS